MILKSKEIATVLQAADKKIELLKKNWKNCNNKKRINAGVIDGENTSKNRR